MTTVVYAWLLIAGAHHTYNNFTVSDIASHRECIRLAHAVGETDENHGVMFGASASYECHRYQKAR